MNTTTTTPPLSNETKKFHYRTVSTVYLQSLIHLYQEQDKTDKYYENIRKEDEEVRKMLLMDYNIC